MILDGAILDSLNQKAEALKPGSEIVIKMTQEELNKHLQGKLKDGSFFEYDPEKKQVIIYKPKKKNYACAEEALDSGLDVQDAVDACSDIGIDEDGANVDWSDTTKKAEQVAQKEQQVAQKEQQVAELEKMVKAEGYLGYLQDKTILIGKNIDNRKLVLNTLNEILKNLRIGNLKGNEYGEQIGRVLKKVKTIYKIKGDKVVPNKVDTLLKRLNLN